MYVCGCASDLLSRVYVSHYAMYVYVAVQVSAPTSTGVHAVLLAAQMDHGPVVKFLLDEVHPPHAF